MRIIMLGPPGSGKGTQSMKIVEQFTLPQLSTGDMLRSEAKSVSKMGKKVKDLMDVGILISDELVMKIIEERIAKPDCQLGYLLDGFPRTRKQAVALEDLLYKKGEMIDRVIELIVDEQAVVRRINGRRFHLPSGRSYHVEFNPPKVNDQDDLTGESLIHREDDKGEIVLKRIRIYNEQTQPLVDYYKEKNLLSSVDGMGKPEDVFERIKKVINELKSKDT